jgi:hypothetical protein|tara:strand:- start:14274 stop:15344 length:1071 start_codon:yes stop_codon:yes gene_type:complete
MGISGSKTVISPENSILVSNPPEHSNISFLGKEIKKLNGLVDDIVTTSEVFINKDYASIVKKRCNKYVILSSTKLKRFKRTELEYEDSKITLVETEKIHGDKRELCDRVSRHFRKMLHLLCAIKYAYDIENEGENSISGLVLKNITNVDGKLSVSYCATDQNSHNIFGKEGVDFSSLSGFEYFMKNILSEKEASDLLHTYQDMLNQNNPERVKEIVCKYVLYKTNPKTMKNPFNCKFSFEGGGDSTMILDVPKNNPILSLQLCSRTKTINVSDKTKKLIISFKANYKKNITEISKLLKMLTFYNKTTKKHELRIVEPKTLDEIEMSIKQTIIMFYINSLYSYREILYSEMAKKDEL